MIRHTARSSKRYQATGKRAEVIKFTKSQGPGYRDGARTYRPNLFEQRLEDYARKSAIECEKIDSHAIDAITFHPLYAAFPQVCWKHIPIFLVHDDKSEPLHSLDVHYFGSIQIIQETEKFKKQLTRLSEKLQKKMGNLKREIHNHNKYG